MLGTPGDDELIGGTGNDTIRGGAGNDSIGDYGGDDRVFGEAGDDRLSGGSGDDYISGGPGNDYIFVGETNSIIDAGAGNDEVTLEGFILPTADITLGAGTDTFSLIEEYDEFSADAVSVGIGTYVIRDFTHGEDVFGPIGIGRYGVEFLTLDSNRDDVVDGRDVGVSNAGGALVIDVQAALYAAEKAIYERDLPGISLEFPFDDPELESGTSVMRLEGIARLTADDFRQHPTAGNDEIYGTSGRDVIRLGDGNDIAYGNPQAQSDIGDDLIYGESGNDVISGDAGNDVLIGGSGNDKPMETEATTFWPVVQEATFCPTPSGPP